MFSCLSSSPDLLNTVWCDYSLIIIIIIPIIHHSPCLSNIQNCFFFLSNPIIPHPFNMVEPSENVFIYLFIPAHLHSTQLSYPCIRHSIHFPSYPYIAESLMAHRYHKKKRQRKIKIVIETIEIIKLSHMGRRYKWQHHHS